MLIPQGYRFAVAAGGFKKPGRLDLGVVESKVPAAAAGVFTTNKFQAAPVLAGRELLEQSETARAVVINSGQANACTGDEGLENCRVTRELIAQNLGLQEDDILPASTGVIGDQLKMDKWSEAMEQVRESFGKADPMDMAKAIMTTDSFPKLAWRSIEVDGREVRVLGMCKGAGMICPNMATLLGLILTDAGIDPALWRRIISWAVQESFNRVTVDGDTSTNDTVYGLANGASGVTFLEGAEEALAAAVLDVCQDLAYLIVQDAEGGTKIVQIDVVGAKDDAQADLAARAVGNSPLVKTAMYGKDPNWGRIAAALGRSGADFDPNEVSISIGAIEIFKDGQPISMDIDSMFAPILDRQDVEIKVILGSGEGESYLLASDLTHEYVTINADYRT
ncbi:bifunctional glutamate N-acetyltransferase/amino-acid acetyltransferase ArgJ [Desulfovibrio ferrophilus]|uniref:Arginine biosynthesis bifunctional protein ArgJ n=1 Tax=Desulfovibrio ferrophilus TaxID=241368 RepID=A0A2Z6B061_9BACT|nr:bifunctional glutamate N-acetyltransferase/amino-acid acetyltransferase ArgJ [Desulfovibrio ferrophilus]BBD08843.1 arginine biosynthesis bifunctional protein ArgJ [Desulfovibrio ferrophilus]